MMVNGREKLSGAPRSRESFGTPEYLETSADMCGIAQLHLYEEMGWYDCIAVEMKLSRVTTVYYTAIFDAAEFARANSFENRYSVGEWGFI